MKKRKTAQWQTVSIPRCSQFQGAIIFSCIISQQIPTSRALQLGWALRINYWIKGLVQYRTMQTNIVNYRRTGNIIPYSQPSLGIHGFPNEKPVILLLRRELKYINTNVILNKCISRALLHWHYSFKDLQRMKFVVKPSLIFGELITYCERGF